MNKSLLKTAKIEKPQATDTAEKGLWIVGCGDIGRRVARLYQKEKNQTSAIVRSEESKKACQAMQIDTFALDLDSPSPVLPEIKNADVFYFAPPSQTGKYDSRIRKVIQQWGSQIRKLVLISTTGVYGDCQGNWVDESQLARPNADRAYRRWDAEQVVQEWGQQSQGEWIILRVPGIYALERLPLRRIAEQIPMVTEQESPWTNRIHADDLAKICKAAMASDIDAEIINACDGNPTTMTEYFNKIADYAGLPRPPQISLKEAEHILSKGMLSYLRESRKINNQKLYKLLNIKMQYPSLDQFLQENEVSISSLEKE